jgi:hypothetical protein
MGTAPFSRAARDLPCFQPAHTVGQHTDPELGVDRNFVFVGLPDPA